MGRTVRVANKTKAKGLWDLACCTSYILRRNRIYPSFCGDLSAYYCHYEIAYVANLRVHGSLKTDLVKMHIGDVEIAIRMRFDYRDGSDDASGTDTKELTSVSDEDISSPSDDEEGYRFIDLLDKEPLQTKNMEELVLLLREKIKHLLKSVGMNLL